MGLLCEEPAGEDTAGGTGVGAPEAPVRRGRDHDDGAVVVTGDRQPFLN
jgi:hypothetical protein